MRNVPTFKNTMEARLGLQLASRVLRLEAAQRWSEKVAAAKDIKTFVEAFQIVLKGAPASEEFIEYVAELKNEVRGVLKKDEGLGVFAISQLQPSPGRAGVTA